MYVRSIHSLLPLVILAGCGTEQPAEGGGDTAGAPMSDSQAEPTAPPEVAAAALAAWAERGAAVVVLDVVSIETYTGADALDGTAEVRTVAWLEVDEVVRGGPVPDHLQLDLPGGTVGESSFVSSEAPLLFADDRVVARLRRAGASWTFDGHASVLPVDEDGLVDACVNPDPAAVRRCVDQGSGLVFLPEAEAFPAADFHAAIPLQSLSANL